MTDKERLDWLSRVDYFRFERDYEAFVDRRPKYSKDGMLKTISGFSCESQHVHKVRNVRKLIDKMMKKEVQRKIKQER